MEVDCRPLKDVLSELDAVVPAAPLLALGQTVWWDEPMKAGLKVLLDGLGSHRRFVAGVHDTDYFGKLNAPKAGVGFKALPHNDTSTKNLWSAAGEFSQLFGSETVVSRDLLAAAGTKLSRIEHERPGWLDRTTEAWGWRGVVSLSQEQKTIAQKRLGPLFPELFDALTWAIESSLEHVSGPHQKDSEAAARRLQKLACTTSEDPDQSLADYYESLITPLWETVAGQPLELETTRTTRLLAFSPGLTHQPRFDVLRAFLNPATRVQAEAAYNRAVAGTEVYTLDRFGSCALPFDVIVPGHGRGTLRLGNRGGVIMTPQPVGFSFRRPIESTEDLAQVLEARFGPGVVLVGKAVMLPLMLSREFVFVFHEGASGYVPRTAAVANALREIGIPLELHPILRVRWSPWDAMTDCCAWIRLPEPMQRPFGTEELSADSFALRWRQVVEEQEASLKDLASLRGLRDLVRYLETRLGGHWSCLADAIESTHQELDQLQATLKEIRLRKQSVLAELKVAKAARAQAERELGNHWRAALWEKDASPADWAERDRLAAVVAQAQAQIQSAKDQFRALQTEQNTAVTRPELDRIRERRRAISLEAELMRATLAREAIVTVHGLRKAGHRPSAWWMSLVCPGGAWFRSTLDRACAWWEPL